MSDYHIYRSLVIRAERSTVFRFFTNPRLFALWWGAGSTIDAQTGGAVRIVYPGGSVAAGEVIKIDPETKIEFTFGYEQESKPIPPGGSLVVITLEDHSLGTLLHLDHKVDDPQTRDQHIPGWRFQLALIANAAAAEQHADLDDKLDRYFALWSELDKARRAEGMTRLVTQDVALKGAFACVEGLDEFLDHLTMAQAHSPVVVIERDGPVRQCQGTAVVNWLVRGPDGQPVMGGSNVVELAPDGRFASICSLWNPPG